MDEDWVLRTNHLGKKNGQLVLFRSAIELDRKGNSATLPGRVAQATPRFLPREESMIKQKNRRPQFTVGVPSLLDRASSWRRQGQAVRPFSSAVTCPLEKSNRQHMILTRSVVQLMTRHDHKPQHCTLPQNTYAELIPKKENCSRKSFIIQKKNL